MTTEIISKAIKIVGFSIDKESYPYTATLSMSPVLWERYLEEIRQDLKRNGNKLPEQAFSCTTGIWQNQNKSVVLYLVKADITSPELESALIKTITDLTLKLNKKINELSVSPLQKSTRPIFAESRTHVTAIAS